MTPANVAGSDGGDFSHRQKIAEQYYISAQNKYRLKCSIFCHFILFALMMMKLSVDILDRLDIFILEIEELEVPKPLLWEYIWASSILTSFLALAAIKKNQIATIKRYLYATAIFGLGPIIYCTLYYFGDIWQYVQTGSLEGLFMWRGYPYSLMWYGFILLALQVHTFCVYFSFNLLQAWMAKGNKKKAH